jgi:hypothetical protein
MKKILALSALLLVAFTCDAAAGTETTLVLDGRCGFFGVEMGRGTAKPGVAIINQSGSGCSGSQYGVGVIGAALTGRFGGALVFSVTTPPIRGQYIYTNFRIRSAWASGKPSLPRTERRSWTRDREPTTRRNSQTVNSIPCASGSASE